MYANTLLEGTRMREGNNQSTYRNNSATTDIEETIKFAHGDGGKFGQSQMKRHLVSCEIVAQPTATNGLVKPERLIVNLTVTHTDGVATDTGTGVFAHLAVRHQLLQLIKLVHDPAATAIAGTVSVPSILAGEI